MIETEQWRRSGRLGGMCGRGFDLRDNSPVRVVEWNVEWSVGFQKFEVL